ncbi:hypothetical protein OOK58_59090 [Streptomyces sp. NBC_01728]|uniref:hypothetical protein n=1 Tax=unclassified Streptomyces TaxID=2593676 RepID=UPI002255A475|nr:MULTISPECIES: hypothetical protein [unclassified Streptomyces]MCX4462416.1 hypothetical protein [Streptomyces sp. NBC_01719]MCX4500846.1 hypothetical protein [Streptomyces sp. NBC_01728]
MNEPMPFDATTYLIAHEHQITAPVIPGVAPLPPVKSAARVLWEHFGRIAPGLVTTAATALAWGWHEQLPDGSTQPLWIGGLLALLAGAAGTISAAKQNGGKQTTTIAFAGGGIAILLGLTAWTPDSALRALMWLVGTAAVYAVCAPLWRSDRRLEREQRHEQVMTETKGRGKLAVALVEGQTRVVEAQWAYRTEAARVEAISRTVEGLVEASNARAARALEPGEELNIASLLKAAGHERTPALESSPVDDEYDIEALLRATSDAPHEPSAADRQSRRR